MLHILQNGLSERLFAFYEIDGLPKTIVSDRQVHEFFLEDPLEITQHKAAVLQCISPTD